MTRFILGINKGRFLAISIGVIYFWFGMLKFFPELSPAEDLAKKTITFLTIGVLPENISIVMLAVIEVIIGCMLIFNLKMKVAVTAALLHLVLTFIPLICFSEDSFTKAPYALTLVGQYIIKNIVIISALLFIYPIENYKVRDL
ncbi:doxx family protein [Thalassobellus suaedae]|uniref:Doxx family protein n=1 Tax=Thalassobellus suaedae TaxID=3074124 RepID=A0ABY9Y4Z5_9FLAO|nr:doxx family protein [Flavobacteriaceae bacterium HL-DH14]WNH13333.1 doxx family protein [Flavobacteriaceae bacterium HL-DH10]